jgi:hypothetical protein
VGSKGTAHAARERFVELRDSDDLICCQLIGVPQIAGNDILRWAMTTSFPRGLSFTEQRVYFSLVQSLRHKSWLPKYFPLTGDCPVWLKSRLLPIASRSYVFISLRGERLELTNSLADTIDQS